MNQTISLPKATFEEIVTRLYRLEKIVFGEQQSQITDEKIQLSSAAKIRYKKIDEDIKNGKNIYVFDDGNSALKFLHSDKK